MLRGQFWPRELHYLYFKPEQRGYGPAASRLPAGRCLRGQLGEVTTVDVPGKGTSDEVQRSGGGASRG